MEEFFKHLPGSARVWIYQSSRELSDDEVLRINNLLSDFLRQWTSHARKVIAEGIVLYNRFLILAADESAFAVSGCSIDASVNFIRQLERQFHTDFFNRLAIAYRENGAVKTADKPVFQQMIDQGLINHQTVVFNNLVSTVNDFKQHWEVPLARSWHAKFFRMGAGSF